MKVLLIVQREPGTADTAWVEDACDEYTIDSWNGDLPKQVQEKVDEDPANFRHLWIEIPDDALSGLWDVPTVPATVLPEEQR